MASTSKKTKKTTSKPREKKEKTIPVVINRCYGGFSLSVNAIRDLREAKSEHALAAHLPGEKYDDGTVSTISCGCRDIPRNDPHLVALIREKGPDYVGGDFARLEIVEIPADVKWYVHEYDGYESVYEEHRTWP